MYSLQDLHIYYGVGQVKDMVEYLPMSYLYIGFPGCLLPTHWLCT